jgi:hypothetical protein
LGKSWSQLPRYVLRLHEQAKYLKLRFFPLDLLLKSILLHTPPKFDFLIGVEECVPDAIESEGSELKVK